jgi:predicted short-subunit dehydrogenase-like oxidoreductase (DUF2520 family)
MHHDDYRKLYGHPQTNQKTESWKLKIVLLGSGNVATHLGLALKRANHQVLQVYGRNEASVKKLAKKLSCPFTVNSQQVTSEADVYFIAVSDHSIREIASTLKIQNTKSGTRNPIVIHTSGSVDIDVLKNKFKNYGVLYPVQTFSINRAVDFKTIPVCIEAVDEATRKKITSLAKTITKKIHFINSPQRKQVHLAAVFANNFSNHLFAIAEHLLEKEKIPFDLLRPLILETALKVQHESPLAMQTGPARRGDASTIGAHLKMLNDKKELKKIYKLITESISEMSGIRL